jgi:hypothetical protein|tara:strand:+ start:329 stop:565 length:237 start_codon:yes stop_codon:yes gene_type:complete
MDKWTDGTFQEKSYKQERIVGDRTFIVQQSKREDVYKKLENRELLTHNATNPFMTNNSYIKDLETQDKFLIPQNSNFK